MKPTINLSVFKHTAVAGSAMNNLLTLIHLVEKEGTYTGEILMKGKHYAGFTLDCSTGNKKDTLHIDLSLFDVLHAHERKQPLYRQPVFHLRPGGVVMFFISGSHHALSVNMTRRDEQGSSEFNSEKLGIKDKAAIRLFQFGKYIVSNPALKQSFAVEVGPKEKENYSKTVAAPLLLNHSKKGFNKEKFKIHVGQVIVLDSEGEFSVEVKMVEEK